MIISIVLWAMFSIIACAMCSFMEGVLLSVRITGLIEHQEVKGVRQLLAIKQKRIGDAISTILIINTLAATVGPGFVGAHAARVWGDLGIGITSAVLTVLLLFLSEIAPKTYATTHATDLAGPVGRLLSILMKILWPVLLVSRLIMRWMKSSEASAITRSGLARYISNVPSTGAIASSESHVISHMLFAHEVVLQDIQTPIDTVLSLDKDMPAHSLVETPDILSFARIPLHSGDSSTLLEYVNQREVLFALVKDRVKDRKLDFFAHPLPQLPDTLKINEAIEWLLGSGDSIGAVTADGISTGIVTLEDLFEALLGFAITDETEEVAQLRPAIVKIRKDRLDSLKERRDEWAAKGEP
ncbi:CNNM domain-containing protein [Ochrobactrum sp. BD22]